MVLAQLKFSLSSFKLGLTSDYFSAATPIGKKYFFIPFSGNVKIGFANSRRRIGYFFYNKAFYKTYINKIRYGLMGIQYGYYSELVTRGVGYRFEKQDKHSNVLTLNLGYSHFIFYRLPHSINFRALKTYLFLFSNDAALLTQIAYRIKSLKLPDVYKGKGLRYYKEIIARKVGKQRQR